MNKKIDQVMKEILSILLVANFLLAPVLSVQAEETSVIQSEETVGIESNDFLSEAEAVIEENESENASSLAEASEDTAEKNKTENQEPSKDPATFELQNTDNADPAKPAEVDPKSFLESFQGKHEVDLFSGILSYNFPIWTPGGRGAMTPSLSLRYSSSDTRFDSPVGQGWSLPMNGIYRTPKTGVDKTFTEDSFSADIWGQSQELVLIDPVQKTYGAKTESSFTQYQFHGSHWTARTTDGTQYFFGQRAEAQQFDSKIPPTSPRLRGAGAEIFQWKLERVEDRNGNFMTFTYAKDGNQIYPDTIRYTGHGADSGNFLVKFHLIDRPSSVSYRTGFRVESAKLIDRIELQFSAENSPETILEYDFDYLERNAAVQLLQQVTVRAGSETLPPTRFEYFDGTEDSAVKRINLLYSILEPYQGVQYFSYKPSTAYRREDGSSANKVPFIIHTVHEHRTQAGPDAPIYTTQYDFSDGHYFFDPADYTRREYAGFGNVERRDPLGHITKLYFHQSENSPSSRLAGSGQAALGRFEDHISKKGKQYRNEQWDADGSLLQTTISKWDKRDLTGVNRWFPFLSRQVNIAHNPQNSAEIRATATESVYDDYGNTIQQKDFGEVDVTDQAGNFTDIGADYSETNTVYAENSAEYLHRFPVSSERRNAASELLGKQAFWYDDLPTGQVTLGNQTASQTWFNDTDFLRSEQLFNEYGLVTETRNPRNFSTTIGYDEYNLYPEEVVNALGHTTFLQYDPKFGIPIRTVDPNGIAAETVLDNFGRKVAEKITLSSQLENQSLLESIANVFKKLTAGDFHTLKTYAYDLDQFPIAITETVIPGTSDTNASPIQIQNRTYFDGHQRPIQTRTTAEGNDVFLTTQTEYDPVGQISAEFLPVYRTGFSYAPLPDTGVKTVLIYDGLGRNLTTTTPLGTTTQHYDRWTETITDPLGNSKNFTADSRGNLVQVTEYLDGQSHDTTYVYDLNNNLVQMTNAADEKKFHTYDLIGRKTSESLWAKDGISAENVTFTYDANGNVVTQTNARGQTTTFAYDALDRLTAEDNPTTTDFEAVYTYDTGDFGIGRVTEIASTGATKAFTYDGLGRISAEKITIDGQDFTSNYAYDFLGNPLIVTLPDGFITEYRYNDAGQVEQIAAEAPPGSPSSSGRELIVADIDYAPTGATSLIAHTNGTTTTSTFDPQQLYRLTHKTTEKSAEKLQDLGYSYDAVGNVLSITDTSDTDLQKIANYTYDDWYRLKTANITTPENSADFSASYAYALNGNMTEHSEQGSYVYNDAHPHAVTQIGANSFTYDVDGNLLTGNGWTHDWDARDRILRSQNVEKSVEYTYDETGQRMTKLVTENAVAGESDLVALAPPVSPSLRGIGNSFVPQTLPGRETSERFDQFAWLDGLVAEAGDLDEDLITAPQSSPKRRRGWKKQKNSLKIERILLNNNFEQLDSKKQAKIQQKLERLKGKSAGKKSRKLMQVFQKNQKQRQNRAVRRARYHLQNSSLRSIGRPQDRFLGKGNRKGAENETLPVSPSTRGTGDGFSVENSLTSVLSQRERKNMVENSRRDKVLSRLEKQEIQAEVAALESINETLQAELETELDEIFTTEERAVIGRVEPDFVLGFQSTPNDPWYDQQTSLQRIGYGAPPESPSTRGTGSEFSAENSVVVAVIDTGVDFSHPDLSPNQWTEDDCVDVDGDTIPGGCGAGGYDALDNDTNPTPSDGYTHGTSVASLIGSVPDNGVGLASQAGENIAIMSLRTCCTADGLIRVSDVVEAIQFAVLNGADIINMSFGGPTYSATLHEAIEYAAENGVLVVAAAGNYASDNDTQPMYPANFDLPNVISVAALQNLPLTPALSPGEKAAVNFFSLDSVNTPEELAEQEQVWLAGFSNYGDESVDIAVEGSGVLVANGTQVYSRMSGTSFAAPLVTSGLAKYLTLAQPLPEGEESENETPPASPSTRGIVASFLADMPSVESLKNWVKNGKILRWGLPELVDAPDPVDSGGDGNDSNDDADADETDDQSSDDEQDNSSDEPDSENDNPGNGDDADFDEGEVSDETDDTDDADGEGNSPSTGSGQGAENDDADDGDFDNSDSDGVSYPQSLTQSTTTEKRAVDSGPKITKTTYVNKAYQVDGETVRRYIYLGDQRLAAYNTNVSEITAETAWLDQLAADLTDWFDESFDGVLTANDVPDDLVALAGFPSNPNRYLRLKKEVPPKKSAENSPPESPSTRGTEDYQKKFKTLRERLLALREKAKQTRLARLGEVIAKQVRKIPRKKTFASRSEQRRAQARYLAEQNREANQNKTVGRTRADFAATGVGGGKGTGTLTQPLPEGEESDDSAETPITTPTGNTVTVETKNQWEFYHTDHLGGASVTTDGEGNVIEQSDFTPYGNERIKTSVENYENPYQFTGQEKDNETGLSYYGARYYDPTMGRFLSRDPWAGDLRDPQSFNKYSYVRNNPLKYNDPTGENWEDFLQGFFGIETAVSPAPDSDLNELTSPENRSHARAGESASLALGFGVVSQSKRVGGVIKSAENLSKTVRSEASSVMDMVRNRWKNVKQGIDQMKKGKYRVIAPETKGNRTNLFREAYRQRKKYRGNPSDYQKIGTKSIGEKGDRIRIHSEFNTKTGTLSGTKVKTGDKAGGISSVQSKPKP